ncbi:hypothetical protein SAMN05421730_1001475 [Anaerobium acetethylicum]|uniref:Polymerase/histidinol phosphatase N-terminal domain-containing protein n=2 Tax=Anaerobium acetethylicum TaxID=1619234 RepID=A0A1D3TPH9_9FIRM|nr:hypothetical protein SAMN05421730_1001475 [Anaerobium acetethylicum]
MVPMSTSLTLPLQYITSFMNSFSYDLHIHSCLSPCADDDMTPGNILGMAALKELDIVALTDHNSCKNCPAFIKMAREFNITAIPGMELCTSEEVHVICLFRTLEDAMAFDQYVDAHIIHIPNNESIFGKQEIYDENDEITGKEPDLLINATDISFTEVHDLMNRFNGIMIPAHIDKNSNSLISNLGFIPPDSHFKCAELKNMSVLKRLLHSNPYLETCKTITNSDAHMLGDINEPVNFLHSESREIGDILDALNTSPVRNV